MKWVITAVSVALLIVTPAAADTISWGPASLGDDTGGNFLVGATYSQSGSTASFSFPSFHTSGTFGFPSNELDLGVSAFSSGAPITGVQFTYFGSFTGSAFAQFLQTANAAPPVTGTFSSGVFSGFIPVTSTNTLNLTTRLNLFDQGFNAAISRVEFSLQTIPEPSTIMLFGSALAALLALRSYRRRR